MLWFKYSLINIFCISECFFFLLSLCGSQCHSEAEPLIANSHLQKIEMVLQSFNSQEQVSCIETLQKNIKLKNSFVGILQFFFIIIDSLGLEIKKRCLTGCFATVMLQTGVLMVVCHSYFTGSYWSWKRLYRRGQSYFWSLCSSRCSTWSGVSIFV